MKRLWKVGIILALGILAINFPMNPKISYALYYNNSSDLFSSYNRPLLRNNPLTSNVNQNFSFSLTPNTFNYQSLLNTPQSYSFVNRGMNNTYYFPSTPSFINPLANVGSSNSHVNWKYRSQNFPFPTFPINSNLNSYTPYALNTSHFIPQWSAPFPYFQTGTNSKKSPKQNLAAFRY